MSKLTICTLLCIVAICAQVFGRSTLRVVRSPKVGLMNKPRPEDEPCETLDDPCGWAVYVRSSREVDYYIYNCKCQDGFLCTKYEDDLSAKAFVYKCRVDDTAVANATASSTTQTPT